MTNDISSLSIVMAVAELAGAAAFIATQNTARRTLLSCFGLGFALFIVLVDIVPDAVEDNPWGWPLSAIGIAVGASLMLNAGRRGAGIGKGLAIVGMGLHNLGEGIVLSAGSVISLPLFLAAIAHKLPEGMLVFSLAERLSARARWVILLALAALIPLAAMVPLPKEVMQPALAFAAGILGVVFVRSLVSLVASDREPTGGAPSRSAAAMATAAGAALAGLTCLVI
jgi:zinc transporter ZupT